MGSFCTPGLGACDSGNQLFDTINRETPELEKELTIGETILEQEIVKTLADYDTYYV